MADLLSADPRGVIFGRSMTQLTMDMARTLAKDWRPGDQVTRFDHDANVRPWTIAAARVRSSGALFADADRALVPMSMRRRMRKEGIIGS
jgi:selenocysteine lyase/cysteine desulfurase